MQELVKEVTLNTIATMDLHFCIEINFRRTDTCSSDAHLHLYIIVQELMNSQLRMEISFLPKRISSLTLSVQMSSVLTTMHVCTLVQLLVEGAALKLFSMDRFPYSYTYVVSVNASVCNGKNTIVILSSPCCYLMTAHESHGNEAQHAYTRVICKLISC